MTLRRFTLNFSGRARAINKKPHGPWTDIWKPKDQGGLRIMSSKRMNIALLTKWMWRITNNGGGLGSILSRRNTCGDNLLCSVNARVDLSSGSLLLSYYPSSVLGPRSRWDPGCRLFFGLIVGRATAHSPRVFQNYSPFVWPHIFLSRPPLLI